MIDEQSGAYTYAEYIVVDDFGVRSDFRKDHFDRDKTEGEGSGLHRMDIQSGSVFDPFPGIPDGGACAHVALATSVVIIPSSASIDIGESVTFRVLVTFSDTDGTQFDVTDCPNTAFGIAGAPLMGENLNGNVYHAGVMGTQHISVTFTQGTTAVSATSTVTIGSGGGGNTTIHASNESFVIITDAIGTLFAGPNMTFALPAHHYTMYIFTWSGSWAGTGDSSMLGAPPTQILFNGLIGVADQTAPVGDGSYAANLGPNGSSTDATILALINAAAGGNLTITPGIDFHNNSYVGNDAVFTTTHLTLTLTW